MKNKMFSGWKDVFLFTLKQGFGQKYKLITIILAVILLGGGFAFNVISASGQRNDAKISTIEKVYVIDESGIPGRNWNDATKLDKEQFPKVCFETTNLALQDLGLQLKDTEVPSVVSKITKEKDHYNITVYLPYGSGVTTDDGENLAKAMKEIVREGLIENSAVDADKVVYVVSGMSTEFSMVGENAKSDSMLLLTTVFPIVFMFGLYFMVIIYGQNMGQIVSVEKSSKLMESLLLMTKPYGLIFGKIIATALMAILQIGVWIAATVGGFVFGDRFVRNSVYAGYDNKIMNLFAEIAADESLKAFHAEAIVLTVIAVCLAFLFYCMLAGAIASFASKADELGSVMMFYNMFIVVGFLGSYIIPSAVSQEWVKVMIRLIPVSAAFLLPGELLLGTVPFWAGVVYLIVLFAWIVFTAVFAGKVYKDQLFYKGQSLKVRLPWVKKDREEESDEEWQILHDEAGRPMEKSQKIGCFFLAISPLAIFLVIQIFASLAVTNVMTRVDLMKVDLSTWEVKEFVDYYHGIEPLLNPLTVMVSHLCIIATSGVWMFLLKRKEGSNSVLSVKPLLNYNLVKVLGVCLIGGIALCFMANGIVEIEAGVVPNVVKNYVKMADSAGFGKSPFAIFAAVCLAPIGEELLCRGICLQFGKKALGKFWYANILQAVLFGVLHLNWVQGVYAFFIGLVLGILVERYQSLLPAMLVHFVVNFSSSTWMPKVIDKMQLTFTRGILLVVIMGVITTAALYGSRERQ